MLLLSVTPPLPVPSPDAKGGGPRHRASNSILWSLLLQKTSTYNHSFSAMEEVGLPNRKNMTPSRENQRNLEAVRLTAILSTKATTRFGTRNVSDHVRGGKNGAGSSRDACIQALFARYSGDEMDGIRRKKNDDRRDVIILGTWGRGCPPCFWCGFDVVQVSKESPSWLGSTWASYSFSNFPDQT